MLAGSYVIVALVMEFITFNFFGAGIMPEYAWLDIAILLLIGAVIFILPSFILQSAVIFALLVLQTVINFVNESLYSVSGNIFSIDMLSLGGEVASTYNSSFVSYPFLFLMIFCVLAETAFLIACFRYKAKHSWKLHTVLAMLVVLCTAQIAATGIFAAAVDNFATVGEEDEMYQLEDDRYLYETLYLKDKAFRKFGTFAFYYKNILNVYDASKPLSDREIEALRAETQKFFEEGETAAKTDYFGRLAGNNLVMVMIESGEWYGINPEYTPTLYALASQGVSARNYYARDKTNHSEAIGIMGSYPLETVLVKNGIYKHDLMGNDWASTLPALFRADGYTTSYFHDNVRSFYARATTHPVIGFEKTYFLEDMPGVRQGKKTRFNDFDSDKLMFTTMLEEIAPAGEKPFFSFLTTVTTHGEYDDLLELGDYSADWSDERKKEFSDNCTVRNLEEYYEIITDFAPSVKGEITENLKANGIEEGSEQYRVVYLRYKRYQAALMDLDRGLRALVKELRDTHRLEDTTIVMYADHTAYFNDQSYYLKGVPLYDEKGVQNSCVPEVYHIPFYIYDGSMPFSDGTTDHRPAGEPKLPVGGKEDRFMCTFDIVPTLLDLFGYRFNSNLYQGTSLFSSADVPTTAFVSRENGMFDDAYYTGDGEECLFMSEEGSAEGYQAFRRKITRYYDRQEGLEKMYASDFFGADIEKYPLSDISELVWRE